MRVGINFSISGWSNRELIFKEEYLKQWFLKMIFFLCVMKKVITGLKKNH